MYSRVEIVYGSQTGTAAEASISLYQECRKRGIPAHISPLLPNCLSSPALLVFLVSTTGDGMPPTHILPFWTQLMSAEMQSLGHIQFTVFGLGDSAYQQFNIVARKLWARLTQLGAVSFYRKGLGDDQHDFEYEGEFDPWVEGLWEALREKVNTEDAVLEVPKPWKVVPIVDNSQRIRIERGKFAGKIVRKTVLSQSNPEVILLHIATDAVYTTGDICELYPENSPEVITQLSTLLHLGLSSESHISMNEDCGLQCCYYGNCELGCVTVAELLRKWVDLHKPPSRRSIAMLSQFANDQTQREKLLTMTSKSTEGRSEFHRYIAREKRILSEILWDFNSITTLPMADLIDIAGLLAPRSYSICSASTSPVLSLLISIKQSVTPFRRQITGLCSQYVKRLQVNDTIRFDITRNSVPRAEDDNHVIIVACGSGIAAFWGMLTERIEKGIGGNVVFFGCREESSWLFKDEMQRYVEMGL